MDKATEIIESRIRLLKQWRHGAGDKLLSQRMPLPQMRDIIGTIARYDYAITELETVLEKLTIKRAGD